MRSAARAAARVQAYSALNSVNSKCWTKLKTKRHRAWKSGDEGSLGCIDIEKSRVAWKGRQGNGDQNVSTQPDGGR